MSDIAKKTKALADCVAGKKKNLEKGKTLLKELKLECAKRGILFAEKVQDEDAIAVRAILEWAVFLAVELEDIAMFERSIQQVTPYYYDHTHLPASEHTCAILGLYLLFLLAQNRIGEFHMEIERIHPSLRESTLIARPIKLEQNIMEGSYNNVFATADDIPHPSFRLFMDMLLSSRLRDDIAECAEASYSAINCQSAVTMMRLGTMEALEEYAEEREWRIEGGMVYFPSSEVVGDEIKSHVLIANMASYAQEIEKIV